MVRTEWDVSGDCENPLTRELHANPPPDHHRDQRHAKATDFAEAVRKAFPGAYLKEALPTDRKGSRKTVDVGHRKKVPLTLELTVRCRNCSRCRRKRSQMWAARAITEYKQASRTWFGTITLHPDQNQQSLARARRNLLRRGVVWETLTPKEQFAQLHQQNAVQLTLWLKRVRKESGAKLRFLLVCEEHKSGLPHYHVLVHEQVGSVVRHRVLSSQWKLGFTNFKIVTDVKQAAYVCKYLSKSALARVRASARYGQRSLDHSTKNEVRENMTHMNSRASEASPLAGERPRALLRQE